jgi:squalene-hopene/tetraprenyl-beta-curcumene cyclase
VTTHLSAAGLLLIAVAVRAADTGPDPKEVQALVEQAHGFLAKRQARDGSFSPKLAGPGVSAVVAAALLRSGYPADDPVVAGALSYIERNVKKDGGIYGRGLANYTTSVAVMALKEANKDGRYDGVIRNAVAFLRGLQHDEPETDPRSGGVGYRAKDRPDMSNTAYFLDALQAAGIARDDPAVQRALRFTSRSQNLPGETNDQPFAKKTTDDDRGGLTYYPFDVDDNPYRTTAGGLHSLGAMTYSGLKSFLYAGVGKDDPRVKAAVDWIRRHYTLDENPGQKQAGLFYYYHTFAKAFRALGQDRFEDAAGVNHDWRRDLFEAIKKRQRPDGGFDNPADKSFGEADPNLATAFAVLALSYTRP